MANTYTLISSATVGAGSAASIEFTSIPQTYTDLVLKISARSDRAVTLDGFYIFINGQPANGTGYTASTYLLGDGSAASTGRTNTEIQIGANPGTSATSNTFSSTEIYFPSYSSTTIKKPVGIFNVTENNATSSWVFVDAGLYYVDNSAITSLLVKSGTASVNLVQYSTAYLYGISNA